MDFTLRCGCGRQITVNEGSAGATLRCECGGAIEVPSLGKLRESAGLSKARASPALVVADLVARGELPLPQCLFCGGAEGPAVPLTAVCEQQWVKKSGGVSVGSLLLFMVSHWILLMEVLSGRAKETVEHHGRDVVVPVPIRLCSICSGINNRSWLISAIRLLQWISFTAAIALLFVGEISWFLSSLVGWLGLIVARRLLLRADQRKLKRALRSVPEYAALMDEYPEARIERGAVGRALE